MFEGGLALGGLSGCSPLGVLPPRFPLGCLLPFWVASAAAWGLASHFFSLPFSFGVVSLHGSWSGFCRGSPFRVVSSCSFLEGDLPPLWRWRVWMAESSGPIRSSGRLPGACLLLSSSPFALHGVVSTSPVCLSQAPAFRQVRVAMLAEGSVESPSVLVLAFHSSLFLVEGSSDGSAPGDRSSPLDGCLFTPFLVEICRFGAISPGVVGFSSSSVCQFTVGRGGTFPRGNCSEFPNVLRLPVLYLVEFCLT